MVILIRKIRFTKRFTHVVMTTRRLASSLTSVYRALGKFFASIIMNIINKLVILLNKCGFKMDLKKKEEEEQSRTGTPMHIDAELMLAPKTGMKKGYSYGFGSKKSARKGLRPKVQLEPGLSFRTISSRRLRRSLAASFLRRYKK